MDGRAGTFLPSPGIYGCGLTRTPFGDGTQEASMKKILLIGAATLLLASLLPGDASAQRGGRGGGMGMGGGFRGGAIGGGGFRGGIGGGGFRGAAIGGFRGGAIGRGGLGFRGPVIGSGVRVGGFRGAGWGGRRGWGGWGWPVAAGLGLGFGLGYPYYSDYYGYSDPCAAWTGYNWINVCY
jgi:hypothetical protein